MLLLMISVMWVCTDTAYSFTYLNVTNLPGNVFINGIVLGLADTCSNALSGYLMQVIQEDNALQLLAAIGLVFNLLLPLTGSSNWSYVVLFVSILGVGGIMNVMICIVELQIEPQKLGTVLQLLMTAGSMMSGFSMFYALLPQPLPLIILSFFISLNMAVSFLLPEGGRYLTQTVKINASCTLIDI
jgi:hypothetical protein